MDAGSENGTAGGEKCEEFTFMENKVVGDIRKRKNWTAPALDGIKCCW